MSRLTLDDLLEINGEILRKSTRHEITGVSIDSRTVTAGEVFFAIRGERFDGHSFLHEAVRKNASAVVVSRDWLPEHGENITVLKVSDTTRALGDLAGRYRKKFTIPVIAITGTNGKTTTKEMLASVLSREFRVLKSEGNYNNQYGLPLTLFRVTPDTEAVIVECGASYPGDISLLCAIALPTHGIITNIGKGHLAYFKTVDEVLRTKAVLLRSLGDNGEGFINGDDPRLKPFHNPAGKIYAFGTGADADYRATNVTMRSGGRCEFTLNGQTTVRLSLPGRNSIYSALASAAVGLRMGMDDTQIRSGIEMFTGYHQRMEVTEWNGIIIINDSYNANPDSMKAALEFLAEYPATGKRYAVLGDMLELGDSSRIEHEAVGSDVVALGINRLVTLGSDAYAISLGARKAGLGYVNHAESHIDAANLLRGELKAGDVILIKGSRGSTMETVLDYLYKKP